MTKLVMLAVLGLQEPAAALPPGAEGPEYVGLEELRAAGTPEKEPRTGIAMMAVGGVMTASGVALAIASAVAYGEGRRCREAMRGECWSGLLVAIELPFAVIGLGVGVPLLTAGIYRHQEWRAWDTKREVSLRPRLGRTRGGWTLGLELRF